jgi:4-hydroxy-2-oxoheptanedioate aldolase
MSENRFRTVLKNGGRPVQAWLTTPSIVHAELLGRAGYDSVCIDLQHSAVDFSDLYPMLAALSGSDSTPMVRVPWNDPAWIQRVLDAGVMGVICPMINTPEEAASFLSFSKIPPVGRRSPGSIRSRINVGSANEEVMAIVQIETPEALDNLEEILSVPGIDGVYPGLSDYALASYGELLDFTDVRLRAPIERIIEGAHAKGIPVGLPLVSMKAVEYFCELGLDWYATGLDRLWFAASAEQTLGATRETLDRSAALRAESTA